jgi:hypothetical protein
VVVCVYLFVYFIVNRGKKKNELDKSEKERKKEKVN